MIYVSDINLKNAIRLTLHVDKWGLRYVELQHTNLDGITRGAVYYFDLGLKRWMGDWRIPASDALNDLFNALFVAYDAGLPAVEEVFNYGKD